MLRFLIAFLLLGSTANALEQHVSVVKVTLDKGKTSYISSGSFIRETLVLTCAHAVKGRRTSDTLTVQVSDGRAVPASVLKVSSVYDLALLKIPRTTGVQIIKFGPPAIVDDKLWVCGFAKGNRYHESYGRMVGLGGDLVARDLFLRTSRPSIQGMSGGPIINSAGQQVGVLWGSDDNGESWGATVDTIEKFLNSGF